MNRIQFDDFEIDLDMFELCRGGKRIEIGAKPLNLLICLIENRERVISREFLRNELWGGAALSPATIPTCALAVRRALADSAEEPRYLKSHRSRGYRFIAEIKRVGRRTSQTTQCPQELPFVGRDSEIALLRSRARESASLHRGHITYITGEAGIGKSRLLSEFSRTSDPESIVLRVKAPPLDGAPSFWPWIQLLIDLQANQRFDGSEVSDHIRLLSRTFPELHSLTDEHHRSDRETHRHNVFSQWANAICSIANQGPTTITVDDAHLMDQESLTLLYWLADQIDSIPMFVVVTSRPHASATLSAGILSDIGALPHADTHVLGPLSRDEISALLDPFGEDNDSLSASLIERTGGNAFYVSHLVHCLDEIEATQSSAENGASSPMHAHEIVSRQLSGLPKDTHLALSAASILGHKIPVVALSAVVDLHPDHLIERLEPALDAWILRQESNHLEFNHGILRESLYKTLSTSNRCKLHLRAAQYLKEHNESDRRATEIAMHLSRALPLADGADTLDYCLRAARRSAARFSYSQAREFYETANRIQDSSPDATFASRCDLLIEMSPVVLFTGDREESRRLIAEAADIARSIQSASHLASCALGAAPDYLTIEVGSHDATLIRLLREALAFHKEADSAIRAVLLGRLCQALQWSESQSVRGAIADESLAIAKESSDSEAVFAGLTAKAECLHGPKQATERIKVLRELERSNQSSLSSSAQLLLHTRLIAAHLENGNFSEIEVENERHKELANAIGLPQFQWYSIATDSMLAAARGNIHEAAELADSYQKVAGPDADHNFTQTFACQFSLRNVELDLTSDHIEIYRDFAKSQRLVKSWRAAYAWALWECEQHANARHVLDSFNELELDQLENEAGGGIGLAVLSEVAAHVGSAAQREDLLSRILPVADRFASAGYGVAYFGSFARYAGILSLSLGQSKSGIGLLEFAVSQESRNNTPSWLAYALLDLHAAHGALRINTPDTRGELDRLLDMGIRQDLVRANRKLKVAGLLD